MAIEWRACGLIAAAQPVLADEGTLEEIVVTASLHASSVAELPQSVTVLDEQTLRAAGVQHFEDVLGLIPDLNWAAGNLAAAFLPTARHRGGRAVPGRAESVGGISDR